MVFEFITFDLMPSLCSPIFILLLGALILLYLNKEEIDEEISVERRDWKLFLVIVTFAVTLFLILNQPYQVWGSNEAPLYHAERFISDDASAYRMHRYGLTFPCVFGGYLSIFQFSMIAASLFNVLIGVLNVFLVFVLLEQLQDRSEVSLLISAIYIFIPHTLIFTSFIKQYFILVQFLSLLSLNVFLLSYKLRKISAYLLAMFVLSLTAQMKPELMLFLGIFIAGFLIFNRRNLRIEAKKLIIPFLIFLFISAPFFFKFSQRRGKSCSNVIGRSGEDILSGFFRPIDLIVKQMSNEFSIGYLPANTFNFLKYTPFLILFLPFIFHTLYIGFKERKKHILFLLLGTAAITIPYLLHCAFLKRQLYNLMIELLAIPFLLGVAGISVSKLKNTWKSKKGKVIISVFLLYILLVSSMFYMPVFEKYNRTPAIESVVYSGRIRNEIPQGSAVIVPTDTEIFSFYGYEPYHYLEIVGGEKKGEENFRVWFKTEKEPRLNQSSFNISLKNRRLEGREVYLVIHHKRPKHVRFIKEQLLDRYNFSLKTELDKSVKIYRRKT